MADRGDSKRTSQRKPSYVSTVPPQEILPVVNSRFESSIPGIYVIGDVTGFPLVKIAANQGKNVIEQMAAQEDRNSGRKQDSPSVEARNPSTSSLDLVIVGGGPAGLSAAIEAEKLGWKYVVLERDQAASTVQNFPPNKKVYSEPASVSNQSELDCESDLEKDAFLRMISAKIEEHQINLKEDTEVTRIRQASENEFVVHTAAGKDFVCRKVIIAIGRQGHPRKLDARGADNFDKVTYRFHTAEDYQKKKVLVVGGGNSAIEAALVLGENNEVTLSYRGDHFYRATAKNLQQLEKAIQAGQIKVLFNSTVSEILADSVRLVVDGSAQTIDNDHVVILIGNLPPIEFLMDTGIELDGVWTAKRFVWAAVGILIGLLIYFVAKEFVLLESKAGKGLWYLSGISGFSHMLNFSSQLITFVMPIPWLMLLGLVTVNKSLKLKDKKPVYVVPGAGWILALGVILYYFNFVAPSIFTLDEQLAGAGPYFLPGWTWMFAVVPSYFGNLSGFYYLLYFAAILVFGLYWAIRINDRIVWKRNLIIIAVQWTLWWGIPTFLVVFLGTNPWTPLVSRLINAWPLKMDAFEIDPSIVRPGDPEWWYTVGVVGVVWAVFLTFVIIPIFTIRFGKIYCSYVCSCGALAETVGNSFRHRGPKGEAPRGIEKYGYVFVLVASIATIGSMIGYSTAMNLYNVWVGTFLAGALAIGLYPFLGQRIWCRMWCPLAFWMNFWGRWSNFKISAEKGKCIDCNICNQYCQMGIDIKSRALQGKPVTLVDTPCVGCAECVMRCPMEILHIGEVPENRIQQAKRTQGELHQIGKRD